MSAYRRPAAPAIMSVPLARLEPDAISAAQDTLIGDALVGPTVSVALTLAALTAATAYAAPLTLLLTAVPVLVIANAYRRLNQWNANSGASFEWVSRTISPYLGFMTGWLMIAGTLIGTLSPVVALGPSVLAVLGLDTGSRWDNVLLATLVAAGMLILSVVGIRISARTQVAIGVTEYSLLIALSVLGLWWVLTRHTGSVPVTRAWFSLHGTGNGSLTAGFLIAVFSYSGWDGTLYVNEEVRHRRENPGRAAMAAVVISAGLFILAQAGLQGAVPAAQLQAHQSTALVYVSTVVAGGTGGRFAALALALSVIAATGAGILLTARIIYGMAARGVLPPVLGNVSARWRTPVPATVVSGVVLIVLAWCYLLSTGIQSVFTYVIGVTGLLYAAFYALTALAAIAYYRRRITSSVTEFVTAGVLPAGAAGFLVWVIWATCRTASAAQNWTLAGTAGAGLLLLVYARAGLRSPFFHVPRETAPPRPAR